MNDMDYSLIFKALGSDIRIQIVKMLDGNALCACKILEEFNITQPTLSHHMQMLVDSNLVIGEKQGKWMFYYLNKEVLLKVKAFFNQLEAIEYKEEGKMTCKF